MESRKACIECGVVYPETTTHFHKSKDGFHGRCRKCRNKKERNARKKKQNNKLAEIERGAVDLFVSAARLGGSNIPHSSEVLEVMMTYFGGVAGFANVYMKQFYDAPVGGAFRTKMLDSLLRLITNNTAMGGAKKPLELMTEEELEAESRRQIMEAAMAMRVNGNQVRLEKKDAELRDMPVVEPTPVTDDGERQQSGGLPPAPADSHAAILPRVGGGCAVPADLPDDVVR
jgi:hypothetical protein